MLNFGTMVGNAQARFVQLKDLWLVSRQQTVRSSSTLFVLKRRFVLAYLRHDRRQTTQTFNFPALRD